MPKVIADITMSLDGFVTGEGADEQHGLGDAPELHTWVRQQDAVDTEVLAQATAQSGAVVMGRRLFDLVNGPDGWSKDMGYGADQAGTPPFFVVTHSPRQDVRLERDLGMRFTFVSDLVTAIGQARSAATDGDVVIMGGGDIIGQALEQGLVEELRLHLAPMALGGGTPLFKSGTITRPPDRDRHDPVAGGRSVRLRDGAACLAYDGPPVTVKNGAAVAQKVQTLFIDDLDGSAAEGTVRFGLDGTEYEIDLNAEHAQQLRDALAAYVRAGRRVSGSSRRPTRGGRREPAGGLNIGEVREWAKAQGIEVKDRGRVPAELVVKFKAATAQ